MSPKRVQQDSQAILYADCSESVLRDYSTDFVEKSYTAQIVILVMFENEHQHTTQSVSVYCILLTKVTIKYDSAS